MSDRILVALGGNAILSKDASAKAQQEVLRRTCEQLVKFVLNGNELIVAHGNGPQVGNLLLQQSAGATDKNPAMPLDTAVAMTEGSIGYWLQNALDEQLNKNKLSKEAATVITQILVNPQDESFNHPSKPIGPFYTEMEAKKIKKEHPNFVITEDSGRGYRRIVASPKPIEIKEAKIIEAIINSGNIPIAVGGGAVPVFKNGDRLEGVEAVIDKDFASEKLAELVNADKLIILTAVDNVYINYNQLNQQKIEKVSTNELKNFIKQGQFGQGSMLPKVEAAIHFVENSKKEEAQTVITSLDNVENYLKNGSGTIITK
jgi:carbamate kinase